MLTLEPLSANHRKVGRRRINDEEMTARFPAGTLARMRATLRPKEKLADVVRVSVERELKRRERPKLKAKEK